VGTARKVEGGYRISALKRFGSGSPAGDLALTSIPFEDQVFHIAVPLKSEGVKIGTDWDTMGMRATGSHTIAFEDVFVPEAAISVRRPKGQWHPSMQVVCVVALPIVVSAYVGLAEEAVSIVRAAKKGSTDPVVHHQMGELETELRTAQLSLEAAITACNNYDFTPTMESASQALVSKTIAARAVRKTLDQAVLITGGGAFYKRSPLEKLWRDAQGVQFHPLQEGPSFAVTGKLAVGLQP
jgi:acyl-CoA dehydrogenase